MGRLLARSSIAVVRPGGGIASQTAAGARGARCTLIDSLRGLAILYIAFDHTLVPVCRLLGVLPGDDALLAAYKAFDLATNGTRITALMLAAGLFLERSCAKGTRRFLWSRASGLLWPLALWSSIQVLTLAMLLPAERSLDLSGGVLDLVRHWLQLSGQFWFLYVLILCQLVFLAVRRLDPHVVLAGAAAAFAGSLLLDVMQVRGLAIAPFRELGHLFIFCWLGHMCSAAIIGGRAVPGRRTLLLCLALFCCLAVPAAALPSPLTTPMLLLSGLPALPLMLALARAVGATPLAPAINLAGRGSLAVLCIQATAAVVIASMLVLLGLDSLWPLTVVTVAASTWLVLGAAEVAQRHGIARALGIAVTP